MVISYVQPVRLIRGLVGVGISDKLRLNSA